MMTKSRPTFTPEFRLEAAQLVVDQGIFLLKMQQRLWALANLQWINGLDS